MHRVMVWAHLVRSPATPEPTTMRPKMYIVTLPLTVTIPLPMAATTLNTSRPFRRPIESASLPAMGATTTMAAQKETVHILRR